MKNKHKILITLMIASIILGTAISKNLLNDNKNSVVVKAETTYFVTIAVEQLTTNHLPNITGTCSIGDNMTFVIKKGATNIVSETITKVCDTSPYSLNPTITLPDGKYKVDVNIGGSGGGQ
jgi:hypothetical protein